MTRPSTAVIAPEVDRLVIAVHRAVMTGPGSLLRELIEPLGLESPGHMMDLAEFLAAGACTVETARLRFRYDCSDMAGTMIEQLCGKRLVDDRLHPSGQLVGVLESILEARADTAATMWGTELDAAHRGASDALSQASGDLVDSFLSLPEPSKSAHRLHHLLTGVRYARMDAHAQAWQAVGLGQTEIVALSSAVASEPVSPVPTSLVDRGWLTAEGMATREGRAARSTIEAATNARCDPMFNSVVEPHRWFRALQSLEPVGE